MGEHSAVGCTCGTGCIVHIEDIPTSIEGRRVLPGETGNLLTGLIDIDELTLERILAIDAF